MKKQILLVEDEQIDARIIFKAFTGTALEKNIHHVPTGEEALGILHSTELPNPDVVLLDLDLPGIKGLEVMHIMKNNPDLKEIPIIILTNSKKEEVDIEQYREQIAFFIRKRPNYPDFARQLIDAFRKLNVLEDHNQIKLF